MSVHIGWLMLIIILVAAFWIWKQKGMSAA